MWLATGCFAPSTNLLKEVTLFLRSKRNQVSADCLNRLQKTLRCVCVCVRACFECLCVVYMCVCVFVSVF